VWVAYDRTTPYFPGETLKATIITTNPTSSSLKIIEPTEAAFYSDTEHCGWPLNSVRTVIIKPGLTIRRTLDSTDEMARVRSFFVRSAACTPGLYQGGFARNAGDIPNYEVGVPVLEASAVALLNQRKGHLPERVAVIVLAVQLSAPPPRRLTRRDEKANASNLSDLDLSVNSRDGEHILVISRQDQPTDVRIATPLSGLLEPCRLGSWTRLLTLPDKVTSLDAAADEQGRIRIEYSSEGGARQTLTLDANRNPILARKH